MSRPRGRLVSYVLPLLSLQNAHLATFDQLEIMDTAGAEQFTALNEVYIKVPPVSSSKDHPAYPIQRARGFVLVFRYFFQIPSILIPPTD